MRLQRISLSWFRGAGNLSELETEQQSIVVYGANGSGKSTFVDAIEYVRNDGKIGHLSHDYSGARQQLGTRNTHTPTGTDATIRLEYADGETLITTIYPDGRYARQATPEDFKSLWPGALKSHQVLRQDALAKFVELQKTPRYSELLPLLGLGHLRQATETIHELRRQFDSKSDKKQLIDERDAIKTQIDEHLGSTAEDVVSNRIAELSTRYKIAASEDGPSLVVELAEGLARQVDSAGKEQKQYFTLERVVEQDLPGRLDRVLKAAEEADKKVDTLADRRLALLEPASTFLEALINASGPAPNSLECPVCGNEVDLNDTHSHVAAQLEAMNEILEARQTAIEKRTEFVGALSIVMNLLGSDDLSDWLGLPEQKGIGEVVGELGTVDINDANQRWSSEDAEIILRCIPILHDCAKVASTTAPPEAKQLLTDYEALQAIQQLDRLATIDERTSRIDAISQTLDDAEKASIDAANMAANQLLGKISDDINRMWLILHPEEPITGVHLFLPEGSDHAIDIGLTFFGVVQPSPRVTLSEGHRNSIGLCIFLALAKTYGTSENIVLLDDVVSSFDRGHRANVVDLLAQEFGDHQVILLTHDREWFSELRFRLPPKSWRYRVLRPWTTPSNGLEFSDRSHSLDEASDLAEDSPEAAGNRARSVMDIELGLAAELLKVELPYLRSDKNDHRGGYEFLLAIISEAKTRFKINQDASYVPYAEPLTSWSEALTLMVPWGNRASHTGTLTGPEATKLISVFQAALGRFRCPKQECGEYVWTVDRSKQERFRCGCQHIEWRYG